MTQILRQSTAVDVLIGPFVDSTDGYTAETGVSPSVKLSKNGQALAAKNDATTPVHDADGYYNCELDATDTNTVGNMVLTVVGSATSLPVRHEFQIVEEAVYDDLYASTASGYPTAAEVVNEWETQSQADPTGFHVNVLEIGGTAQTANDNGADINAILVDTNELQTDWTNGGRLDMILDDAGADAASAVQDTNELQQDWTNGGRLDLILDAIQADTNELQTDDVPGLIAALNNISTAQVNAEVVDALATDTYAEPGQGAPAATATLAAKINYLYKNWRNKKEQTSSTFSLYDDAGTTVDQKATVSDDTTTATKEEIVSGP